jgi:integrase
MQLLTDAAIKAFPLPKKGIVTVRDKKVRGLGVRVLPSGTKAFVLDYTTSGRRRVYTIGKCSDWTVKAAREHATDLQFRIRKDGDDPAQDAKQRREADTVEDLCADFVRDELPKLRPATQSDYQRMIDKDIVPRLGKLKKAAVTSDDVRKVHRAVTERGSPVAANGCVVLIKRIFNYGKVTDNPAKGIKPNPSDRDARYLGDAEIAALTKALNTYQDQDVADIFRLLMFTGARRGEAQSALWDKIDLRAGDGVWTKPSAHTKTKKVHSVPLSPPALAILTKRRAKSDAEISALKKDVAKAHGSERDAILEKLRRAETYVFPAIKGVTGHTVAIKKDWASLCKTAKLGGVRIHDLRHTAASVLASAGVSLLMIGKLLGHTQSSTTARYAHLYDDAQRATADLLGAALSKAANGKAKR